MSPSIEALHDSTTATVTYVVYDAPGGYAAIIDPVLDYDPKASRTGTASAERVLDCLRRHDLRVAWILETHAHADHLSAAQWLKARVGGTVAIGEHIRSVQRTFSALYHLGDGAPADGAPFDHLFRDGDTFAIGALTACALHVPGHTPADIAYRIGDAVFVGDTLFMPDVGTARCDFPGGDARRLYHSIRRLLALPGDTRLFMCHDYPPPGRAAAWESAAVENTGQPRHHGSRSGHSQEAEQRKEKGRGNAKALSRRSSASDAANATGSSKNGMDERDERGHAPALPIQGDLFAALPPPAEAPPPLPTPTEGEDLVADYATLGLTLGRHPLALLRERLTAGRFITAAELRAAPDKKLARAAGIVTHRQRPGTASGIVFVTMEDETGPINVILRPELVEKQRRETLAARLLGVYGQLESRHGVTHLVAKRLVDLTPLLGRLATRSRDFH